MNSTTWSHNAQYWRTFGDGRWRGRSVFVCAHRYCATQPDTSTQQCCTSAAVVWFIANEYLLASLAVSQTAAAHRGNRGVEPLVAESCNSISNTSCCQGEGFTLHSRVDMDQCVVRALHKCPYNYGCVHNVYAIGYMFYLSIWQVQFDWKLICHLCSTLLGFILHYSLIVQYSYIQIVYKDYNIINITNILHLCAVSHTDPLSSPPAAMSSPRSGCSMYVVNLFVKNWYLFAPKGLQLYKTSKETNSLHFGKQCSSITLLRCIKASENMVSNLTYFSIALNTHY